MSAINKELEVARNNLSGLKKLGTSESGKQITEYVGLIEKAELKLQNLLQNKRTAQSRPEIDAINAQIAKQTAELDKLNGVSTQLGKTSNILTTIAAAAGGLFAADKIKDFVMQTYEAAKSAEAFRVSLEVMLKSKEKANTLIGELAQFATQTPFELTEIQKASRTLLAFGIESDKIINTLSKIGNVAAGVNAPIADIALIFGKMRASGRVMTEDLNQLTERGIGVFDELAKTTGLSGDALRKFVEGGKVSFQDIDKIFTDITTGGGKFAGLMAAQMETLGGKASNLADNFAALKLRIGNSLTPAFTGAISAGNFFVNNIENIGKGILTLTPALLVLAGTIQIVTVSADKSTTSMGLYSYDLGGLKNTLYAVGNGFKTLWVTMLANPITAFLTVAASVATAIYLWSDNTEKLTRTQQNNLDIQDKINKGVQSETFELSKLVTLAKNELLSKEQRLSMINQINDLSPEYLGNITLENIGTEGTVTAINNYIKAIESKIRIKIIEGQLQDLMSQKMTAEKKTYEDEVTLWERLNIATTLGFQTLLTETKKGIAANLKTKDLQDINDAIISSEKQLADAYIGVNNVQSQGNTIIGKSIESYLQLNGLLQNNLFLNNAKVGQSSLILSDLSNLTNEYRTLNAVIEANYKQSLIVAANDPILKSQALTIRNKQLFDLQEQYKKLGVAVQGTNKVDEKTILNQIDLKDKLSLLETQRSKILETDKAALAINEKEINVIKERLKVFDLQKEKKEDLNKLEKLRIETESTGVIRAIYLSNLEYTEKIAIAKKSGFDITNLEKERDNAAIKLMTDHNFKVNQLQTDQSLSMLKNDADLSLNQTLIKRYALEDQLMELEMYGELNKDAIIAKKIEIDANDKQYYELLKTRRQSDFQNQQAIDKLKFDSHFNTQNEIAKFDLNQQLAQLEQQKKNNLLYEGLNKQRIDAEIEDNRRRYNYIGSINELLDNSYNQLAQSMMTANTDSITSFEDYTKQLGNLVRQQIQMFISEAVAGYVRSALIDIPFPFGIIAAGVAAFTANTLFSSVIPKFETGGIVGGNNYSGDKIMARVNSGEAILNTPQQSNIMQFANSAYMNNEYSKKMYLEQLKTNDLLKNAKSITFHNNKKMLIQNGKIIETTIL